MRFYHPDVWRDPAYRTRDGIIPFPLFCLYAGALGATLAFDRLHQARAVGHAIALAFSEKGATRPPSLESDLRDAHLLPPER